MVEDIRNTYLVRLAEKTFGIDRFTEVQQEALRYAQKPRVLADRLIDSFYGIILAGGQFFLPTAFREYQRKRDEEAMRGRSHRYVGEATPLIVDGITNHTLVGVGLVTAAATGRVELGVGAYFLGRAAVNVITHAGYDLFRAIEEFRPA